MKTRTPIKKSFHAPFKRSASTAAGRCTLPNLEGVPNCSENAAAGMLVKSVSGTTCAAVEYDAAQTPIQTMPPCATRYAAGTTSAACPVGRLCGTTASPTEGRMGCLYVDADPQRSSFRGTPDPTKVSALVEDTLYWVRASQAALRRLAAVKANGQVEVVLRELHIDPKAVLFSLDEDDFP